MTDVRVIPLDGERPERARGAARGADAVAAGAARAAGERARRRTRTNPLLMGGPDGDASTPVEVSGLTVEPVGGPVTEPPPGPVDDQPASPSVERPSPVTVQTVTAPAEPSGLVDRPPPRSATARKAPARRAPDRPPATPTSTPTSGPSTGPSTGPSQKGGPTTTTGLSARRAPARPAPRRLVVREVPALGHPEEKAPSGSLVDALRALIGAATSAATRRLGSDGLELVRSIADQAGQMLVEALRARRGEHADRDLAQLVAFAARRLTGDFEVDEFGFDAELTDTVLLALLRPLYRRWFRVEVRGIENIPAEGGALVVANHSGAIALDSVMTQVAIHDEHPQHRHLRMLGADLVFRTPVVGELARKGGATLASNADAERLLSQGHVVGVWPEGFKGIGKPFSERYKLQRFGRGGFVSAALRTGKPIVPCAIVGAEETYPIIGNMPTLARLIGAPYAPITPTWPWLGPLGLVPLPSKWMIEFGAPLATDQVGRGAAEDPMLVFDLTDQVRQTIQQTLYSLLVQRRSVFF